jgi:23S rRNA 5-hydroxycytidine C2501 synthase
MTRKISLLAPVRSLEAGIIAVNHGADEIYIGAPKFGARQAAGNSIEDIAALIEYAHTFRVKVYVALNTLIFDSELEEAKNLIWEIYRVGADALIIQDMGILELDLPPIPLHASTQANNVTVEHIQFLEKAGFSRVILARELSIDQIKEIKNATTIELETFIHGALCVSFSGQCYLSHSIGNRSANRGECAQPCRLNYDLVDENDRVLVENKHLLSLRDLNLTESIPQLLDAGITSLKIEGRLKDNAYVANVVSHYRSLIDKYLQDNPQLERSSIGNTTTQFTPDIDKTFNRQYSRYFINGRSDEDITAPDSPKSLGKKIGVITKVTVGFAEIDAVEPLRNGDGICFFTKEGVLQGAYINSVNGSQIIASNDVDWSVGTEVFRNLDTAFEKQMQIEKTKRKISCEIRLETSGETIQIKASVTGVEVESTYQLSDFEVAGNPERAAAMLVQQLSKSGDSIFEVTHVDVALEVLPFLPMARINEIRRTLLEELESKMSESYQREEHSFEKTTTPFPISDIDYNGNISNELSKAFFERHGAKLKRWAPEKWGYKGDEVLMTTKYCLKYSLGWCKIHQHPTVEVPNELFLTHQNKKLKLEFDCKRCVMMVKKVARDF